MNDYNLFLLLGIVKKGKSIIALLKQDLSYLDIAKLTEKAIDENLLEKEGNDFKLTELGESKFEELQLLFKKIKKDDWIVGELKSKIDRMPTDFIYLPNPITLKLD